MTTTTIHAVVNKGDRMECKKCEFTAELNDTAAVAKHTVENQFEVVAAKK